MIDSVIAVADCLGAMTGKRGPVVDPLLLAVSWHAGKMQQHREPRGALNKGPDRGTLQSEDQVAFPSGLATARSSASAGRWVIMISGLTNFLPRTRVCALGTRNARPVRKLATNSRLSAPRPCT